MNTPPRMSRDAVERRIFGIARPLVIAGLLLITLFPFYYMVLLSFRPLQSLLQEPGALWPAGGEIELSTYTDVLKSTAEAARAS